MLSMDEGTFMDRMRSVFAGSRFEVYDHHPDGPHTLLAVATFGGDGIASGPVLETGRASWIRHVDAGGESRGEATPWLPEHGNPYLEEGPPVEFVAHFV